MFLHLQNAIHVTLYIIRRAFISLSSKKNNVHKNVKCSRFECPYCKMSKNYVVTVSISTNIPGKIMEKSEINKPMNE